MYSAPLAPDPPPQSPRVAKHRLKGQLQLLARTCNCRCIQTPGYFYETCSVCAIYNELNRNQGSTLCQRTSITTKTPSSLLGQIRPLTRSDPQIFLTEFTSNSPQISSISPFFKQIPPANDAWHRFRSHQWLRSSKAPQNLPQ